MQVSIIIANYNYARYLNAAVTSVLEQSYQNFEIVIVDDGSTDNSREVIENIQKQHPDRVRTIFQANQGQGGAFNTGFAVSSGEIIAFLDADDVWKPNKLERILREFSDSKVVGVMHQLENIDADGNQLETSPPLALPNNLAELIIKTGNAWFFSPTSALSYRRHALSQVFPVDAVKWRTCVDGCIIYCTSFLGEIKTLPDFLGGYRIHGANNHITTQDPSVNQARDLAGIEMTNGYINQFLEKINDPRRVSLGNNLQYQRTKYYYEGVFSWFKTWEIVQIIWRWHLYSPSEKLFFSLRFLLKSSTMLKLFPQKSSEVASS